MQVTQLCSISKLILKALKQILNIMIRVYDFYRFKIVDVVMFYWNYYINTVVPK